MIVAAYCRVSTDHEDQQNSFLSQQQFFREYISHHSGWTLYEIYADEGITGTNTKKRAAFHKMITDAYHGKFQIILTKEVSRFSRNIVDTILYTRELRAIGVRVFFLTENIDTSDPKSEMLLSFMATLAQEESRRTGARVTWGQQRQMEKGVVFGHSLLGYDVEGGKLRINSQGADLVRLIFQKYTIEKISTSRISDFLQECGYRTSTGNPRWSESHIIKILKNEKYVGDLIQRKSYTPDYLTHQKKRNHGEVPMIIVKNHHEPIINRELWEQTQIMLRQNCKHNTNTSGHSNRYLFSGKIKCGVCGGTFVGRTRRRKDESIVRYWGCNTAVKEGRSVCSVGKMLRDETAVDMIKTAIQNLPLDRVSIIESVTRFALHAILTWEGNGANKPFHLKKDIERTKRKIEKTMDAYFSGEISIEDMQMMKKSYENTLSELENRLAASEDSRKIPELRQQIEEMLSQFLSCSQESEILYKLLLDTVTITQNHYAEFRFVHSKTVFCFQLK